VTEVRLNIGISPSTKPTQYDGLSLLALANTEEKNYFNFQD